MNNFVIEDLKTLVGGTIVGVATQQGQLVDDGFFGLKVEVKGKIKNIWILRDEEANGPGSYEITEEQKIQPTKASKHETHTDRNE